MTITFFHDLEQRSGEWFNKKSKVVTASQLHVVVEGTNKAKNDLLKELRGEKARPNLSGIDPVDWGVENEDKAIDWYSFVVDKEVKKCGFILRAEDNYAVGASPDGLVYVDGEMTHGVEVKCPYNPNVHAEHVNGKIKPAYYWQVLGSIFVSGLPKWDFVSFDPDMENKTKVDFLGVIEFRLRNRQKETIERSLRQFYETLRKGKLYE